MIKKIIQSILPKSIDKIYVKYRQANRNKKLAIEYKGNAVVCSVCGSTYREFIPTGYITRENALCLSCDSVERHRLVFQYLKEKTDFFTKKNIKVLHFGPEKAFYDIFVTQKNIEEYVPCDYFPEVYDFCNIIKIVKVDITAIQFPNNYFDIILCNHVLEHIENDHLAMQECLRILKPNGWGIFQVPIDYKREVTYEDFTIIAPEERTKAFGQSDHVRWYGKDYQTRLTNAGFNVTADNYVNTFTSEEQFKFGFMPEEIIYFCKKG
jgi:SAM-dependent methyltransferase